MVSASRTSYRDVALVLEQLGDAALSLDDGASTSAWRARMALRMRVSMSAIGSVMHAITYQLDLMTPGMSPRSARIRKQIRQSSNLR